MYLYVLLQSLVKAMVFSSSHVWMWELDYKESWVLKHRCFWTVVLEKKEISPEYSSEGLMLKPKLPILWPPDAKWLLGKDTDAREDWRPEKGITEDEMAGWHHRRTRVWASSGSWWWTGKPGLLQSTGSQSWAWLSNWTELKSHTTTSSITMFIDRYKYIKSGHEHDLIN